MRRRAILGLALLALVAHPACVSTWKSARGPESLSPAFAGSMEDGEAAAEARRSCRLTFTLPAGWHWYVRGDDLIATRDGVFLQQIVVERLHAGQADREVRAFGAWSSSAWPVRTRKNLTRPFAWGMPPEEAAEVLLGSRGNDPSVADLEVRKVVTRTIAGRQAFRAQFEFRLKSPVVEPSPLYRSIYCGFVVGDWFYGIGYTATARYNFERDAGTFETFLDSLRLAEE
jgi:hypothetical protein